MGPLAFEFGFNESWGVGEALRDYALRTGDYAAAIRLLSERFDLRPDDLPACASATTGPLCCWPISSRHRDAMRAPRTCCTPSSAGSTPTSSRRRYTSGAPGPGPDVLGEQERAWSTSAPRSATTATTPVVVHVRSRPVWERCVPIHVSVHSQRKYAPTRRASARRSTSCVAAAISPIARPVARPVAQQRGIGTSRKPSLRRSIVLALARAVPIRPAPTRSTKSWLRHADSANQWRPCRCRCRSCRARRSRAARCVGCIPSRRALGPVVRIDLGRRQRAAYAARPVLAGTGRHGRGVR